MVKHKNLADLIIGLLGACIAVGVLIFANPLMKSNVAYAILCAFISGSRPMSVYLKRNN